MLKVLATSDPSESVHELHDYRTLPIPALQLSVWLGQLKKYLVLHEMQKAMAIVKEIDAYANRIVNQQIEGEQ